MNRSRALIAFAVAFIAFATSQLFGARPAAAPPLTFTDIGAIAAPLTPVYYSAVAWGDYNSDGKPDILLTGSSSSGYISKIYKNNGAGNAFSEDTIADQNLTGVSYSSVAWGDYDSDGDLDILLTGDSGGGVASSQIYRNDDGVFTDIGAGLTPVYRGSSPGATTTGTASRTSCSRAPVTSCRGMPARFSRTTAPAASARTPQPTAS